VGAREELGAVGLLQTNGVSEPKQTSWVLLPSWLWLETWLLLRKRAWLARGLGRGIAELEDFPGSRIEHF